VNSMKRIINTVKATVTRPVTVTCNGNVKTCPPYSPLAKGVRRNVPRSRDRLTYLLFHALCPMFFVFCCLPLQLEANVTGVCSNCHTMHNSQGGQHMIYLAPGETDTSPKECLVRGTCLGCHGRGGPAKIVDDTPQVLHTDADLAGGNFAYITGLKARIPSGEDLMKVGHNVIDLGTAYKDTLLASPPGDQHTTGITNANFTCSGAKGCHGDRTVEDKLLSIKGAHHQGVSGKCDTADTVANSYRFLKGVKGHENMATAPSDYRWRNVNSQYHNEYYGTSTPGTSSATTPANNTISGLCAECHGYFHGSGLDEIGGTSSPFIRHPSDILLKGTGEYAAYTTYDIVAPVARPTVYTTINTSGTNDKVTPGTDVIMCLSCHSAHASPHFKMMRWDYKGSTLSTALSGCLVCHTSKN
jgi:hypothetical protein